MSLRIVSFVSTKVIRGFQWKPSTPSHIQKNMRLRYLQMTASQNHSTSRQHHEQCYCNLWAEGSLLSRCMKWGYRTIWFVLALTSMAVALGYAPESSSAGIQIPSARSGFQSDEVNTSSGVRCRQAVGSPLSIDMGVVADQDDQGVYGRITIPIGAPKRLDCSRLYDLEVERLKAEIEMLRGGPSNPYVVD